MYTNAPNKKNKIIHPKLSYQITGLLFETHNKLGCYRNEKQYADYFEQLLKNHRIVHQRETPIKQSFQGERPNRNIPDFIIENTVIIDFKAKRIITKKDYYQMKRYLISANKELGILANFRQKYLTPKRILNPNLLLTN